MTNIFVGNLSYQTSQDELHQAFSQFGDQTDYLLVPGGTFEAGGTPWVLAAGAAVASGNESFLLNAKTDAAHLALPVGASATSPSFCIASSTPTMRLVARTPSASASLRVDLLVPDPKNPATIYRLPLGKLTGSGVWAPSAVVNLWVSYLLPLLPGGMWTSQVVLTAETGDWDVDDVYLDPFKKL